MYGLTDGEQVAALPTCGKARRVFVDRGIVYVLGLRSVLVVDAGDPTAPLVLSDYRIITTTDSAWLIRSAECGPIYRVADALCDATGVCGLTGRVAAAESNQRLFVNFLGFGACVLVGSLTLGLMVLPTIIRATEEALKSIPRSFREASLALGATRWHTTVRVVLPAAVSQILTGVILAVGRAAGETAPIMFTAAVFFTKRLPTGLFSKVMALPYHIYALMTEGTHPVEQTAMAYGTALVLLALVLLVNGAAIFFRIRARKGKKW
ncbi:MAG: ABC transporter permease subunit [bacterium]|nr:ABC transporter permease subunit [bacterium]